MFTRIDSAVIVTTCYVTVYLKLGSLTMRTQELLGRYTEPNVSNDYWRTSRVFRLWMECKTYFRLQPRFAVIFGSYCSRRAQYGKRYRTRTMSRENLEKQSRTFLIHFQPNRWNQSPRKSLKEQLCTHPSWKLADKWAHTRSVFIV